MTYIYAYKRVEETNKQTADTVWYNANTNWNIAETVCNMNESDFLHYVFDPVYGLFPSVRIDKVRILEIID